MQQQTLAQLVRAKYPGAYDDLSDQQLEASVKAKYPGQYDDIPTTKPPTPPKDTFLTSLGRSIIPTPIGGVPLAVMAKAAPAVAAGASVAATGGATLPIVLGAAAAGGAVGQGAKDAVSGEDLSTRDRFVNMGEAAAWQAATDGAGQAVPWMASKGVSIARNLWNRGAKVPDTIARTTQTMRAGGTLEQGKQEIAETVLSHGAGTIKGSNVDALRQHMSEIDDAIETIVQNSPGLVSRHELRQALLRYKSEIPKGSQAGEAARAAVDKSLKTLNRLPAQMPVKKAHELKRHIYETYERTYAADVAQQVTAAADKTTGRALRGAIAREEPAVRPLDAELSKLIPASKAVERAVSRGSNHNVVGLSQTLAGVVTNPATVAAALLNHPKIASFTAQQLYNAASKLPKNAQTASNIIRLASAMVPAASHRQDD